jgi:ABC-type transport system involved in cytochrome bd biosynthesis fused ATPase/permease subunit
LILDEATANLDALTERKMMQALEMFMRGRTTLMISHREAGFEHVDQIVALEHGRVLPISATENQRSTKVVMNRWATCCRDGRSYDE